MPGTAVFYPINLPEQQATNTKGINPKHVGYTCGTCGQATNARVLAELKRECDGANLLWCVCACPKEEPSVVIERAGTVVRQIPDAQEFAVDEKWPSELGQLFEEASRSFAAGAYTASAMVSRKLLMVIAVREGATDGKSFVEYVKFIMDGDLVNAKSKEAIDRIRTIGNDANHQVKIVSREDARRALSITTYMLNAIYALPGM